MIDQKDQRLVDGFRERVRGGATSGLRVTLRIAGGRPSERLEHRLDLEADGVANLALSDALDPATTYARTERLDPTTAGGLWAEIERRADRFVPVEQAAFVPDALIGYATLEIDGDVVELAFAPDQELLPGVRDTTSTPLRDLARRTILAAQRPLAEDEEEEDD
jgi:hypothetical protein